MERSLYSYIWRYSAPRQIVILCITLMSFPILYVSLELPKQIVNDAIGANPQTDFPKDWLGMPFGQVEYLLVLCFSFLGLVTLNGIIKYSLNVYKGLTGERTLRRLRYQLYERVLRFRLPHFGKISSGEIIPMITAEVQPLGGFIGDAIALPAFQGGTLLVYLTFIFVQDPLLGAAAVILYPFQGWLIPKLQKRVNMLAKQRVKNIRQMSDRIGESISGISDIHANDTSAYHLAQLTDNLQTNFEIRFAIFRRKFMIKFINNFINQLTPFFFYSIGGYLVIAGNISFGALVAVLAAYKDLAGPWKELLTYYQQMADSRIKYQAVIEQFDPPDLYSAERISGEPEFKFPDEGALRLSGVTYEGEGSGQNVEGATAEIGLGEKTAVIGGEGSGRLQLLQMISGLLSPTSGRIDLGSANIDTLPESVLGRNIAFVSPSPHMFNSSIRFNLFYALYHRPVRDPQVEEFSAREKAFRLEEARQAGNIDYDIRSEWEDFDEAGVESYDELEARAVALIDRVGLGDDIYRMGLQARLDDGESAEALRSRILAARKAIADEVVRSGDLADYLDLWSRDRFNQSATLLENILYGVPVDPKLTYRELAEDPVIVTGLEEAGLTETVFEVGRSIAEMMVELFSDVGGDSDMLNTFSFIPPEEISDYGMLLQRLKASPEAMTGEERAKITALAFMLIPTRHRLGLMTPEIEEKVIAARPVLARGLEDAGDRRIAFFERDSFNDTMTIEENLIYGKARLDRAQARDRIEAAVSSVVAEHNLKPIIMRAGLAFMVGVGGSRLSAGQKQKIGIVRALLRRPKLLVLDDIIQGYGSAGEADLLNTLFDIMGSAGVIAGMSGEAGLDAFDKTLRIESGRLRT